MQKRSPHQIAAIFGLCCIVFSILINHSFNSSLSELAEKAQSRCLLKYEVSTKAITEAFKVEIQGFQSKAIDLFENEQIGIYIYQSDSLVFWNNACWPMPDSLNAFEGEFGFIKQKNGYFFYVKQKQTNKNVLCLSLVKPIFEIQNNYLQNNFTDWTGLPKSVDINEKLKAEPVVIVNQKRLFSIKSNDELFNDSWADNFSLIIYFLGFVLLGISCLFYIYNSSHQPKSYLLLSSLFVMRLLMIQFNWPNFLYRTALYDLQFFGNAQSWFNCFLGDIFLNAVTLLFIVIGIYFINKRSNSITNSKISIFINCLFLYIVFSQFNVNLNSLVINSTLSFDFVNIFSSHWLLIIAFASYAVYALTVFVLFNSLLQPLSIFQNRFAIFIAINLIVCLMFYLLFGINYWLENVWLIGASVLFYIAYTINKNNLALALGSQILVFSFTTSTLLHNFVNQNQQIDIKLLAQNQSEKKDPILESEFNLIPEKIQQDDNFSNLTNLLPTTEREVIQKLKQNYFSGYFDRYNLDFSLFDVKCNPLLPVKNQIHSNQGYFEDLLKSESDSLGNGLYFFSTDNKPIQYLSYIELKNYKLYVVMEPKQFEETGSFPDLLIDQSLQKQNKLSGLSVGVYQSGFLSKRIGDFNYPSIYRDSISLIDLNAQFEHFYFNTDESTNVIVSQPAQTWKYLFTFNSYILLFFSGIIYLAHLLYTFLFKAWLSNSSLTRRMQTIIILLLLFSMSTVGIISGNLVAKQFELKNQKQLSEKTQTIISELSSQFKINQLFESDQYELLNLKLKEYARLFNTPITVFNADGKLFNSSENKLYDLGLASRLANPQAYQQLKQLKASSVCANEKAGNLAYMSLYTAIFDGNKHLIGFINLPYFAKQNDLSNELSGIISALINVYVILFVLSILAGLLLSGYITRPLRLIQQQIAKISLGKKNEKIIWSSQDEIGKLVFEYNQMLLKLEDSANQLAQSERESAWREMAKQVAHEIKNPLTPMKLNLQYLQHLIKSNPDDFSERFEKASAGIIEQIDSLANIATEFSNFAKLPGTQLQNINLVEVITASTALFENQQVKIISYQIQQSQLLVKGDKDQCLRVFNNILKNALQAVEAISNPQILITSVTNSEHIVIAIRDNGCGIAEELKPKLFTPNFTTKTTGSGLGLAMVKNCMLGFGGDVYFESELNKGSTFYLRFELA